MAMESVQQLVQQALDVFTSDGFSSYRNFFMAVGAVCVLRYTLRTICSLAGGFRTYFLAPLGISRINLKKYGSWAIVTGASEGIGRGYALELARQGLNVVVMSRSEQKLKSVEEEIRSKYNREVRVVPVDFTEGQSVYDDIQAEISDLDVAVLVNNVGLSLACPDLTGNADEERHRNIIEVNCQAMVQMTHLVLPKMVDKKRGIIVNLSSMAAFCPLPLLSVYAATKIFVQYFSDALRYEYKSDGIIVQTVYPGLVATSMSQIKRPSLTVPNGDTYTRSAVATIGVSHDTFGYLFHAIQSSMFCLPRATLLSGLYRVMNYTKLERQQKMKKEEKKRE